MFSKTSACPLPTSSALQRLRSPGDFLDCYSVTSDMAPRPAADIITRFPVWAQILIKLRGLITRPFGLKQAGPEDVDSVGFFPVISESEHELIAGFDDKHLNFCVSVLQENCKVHLATRVKINNLGGRLYLTAIMPFHILIARDALARVARHSGTGQNGQGTVQAQ